MKHNKEVKLQELIDFCEQYNAIGYGKAKICEVKSCIIADWDETKV